MSEVQKSESKMRDYTDHEAAAEKGFHAGWNTFDIQNEGVRYHVLEEIVAAPNFDAVAAEEILADLAALSRSVGYADADSFLHRESTISEADDEASEILEIERQQLFEDYEESDYFAEHRVSLKRLGDVAATSEAKEFLGASPTWGNVYRTVAAAYVRGRDMKVASDAQPEHDAPSPR